MSVIKESIQIISGPLAHIMNLSIAHGVVPYQMKIGRLVPLFKADDQSLVRFLGGNHGCKLKLEI